MGVLEILRAGPEPFSEAERQLLRHVAAQAALALSRAGSGVETGLQELLDIAGEALSATGDGPAVARVAARLASSACRADSALLHAVDEDGLHVLAGFGARLADPLRQGPLDALALEALRHDDAIVTGGDGSAALAGGIGSGAVLSVVLRTRGEALGVLQLLFAERERADAAAARRRAHGLRDARRRGARRRPCAAPASPSSWPMRARSATRWRPAGEPSTQRALEAALRLTGLTTGASGRGPPTARCARSRRPAERTPRAALVAALLDEAGSAPALRGDLASDTRLAPLARTVDAGSAVIIPLALRDLDVGVLALLSPAAAPPAGAAEVALRVAGVTAAVLAADEQRRIAEQTARGAKASEITARSVAVRLEAHEALADAALEGGDPDGALAAAAARIATVSTCAVQRLRPDGTLAARRAPRRGQCPARAGRPRARPPARRHDGGRRARARGRGRRARCRRRRCRPARAVRAVRLVGRAHPARPARRDPRRGRDGLARPDASGHRRRRAGRPPARLALAPIAH